MSFTAPEILNSVTAGFLHCLDSFLKACLLRCLLFSAVCYFHHDVATTQQCWPKASLRIDWAFNRFLMHEYFEGAFKSCLCFSQCEKTTLPGFFDLLEAGYHNTEIVSWNKYIQVPSFCVTLYHLLLCSQRRFSLSWGKVHAVIDGSSIYSLKWQFWKHVSLTTQRVGGQWKGRDNWGSWKWNDIHGCQMPFPF